MNPKSLWKISVLTSPEAEEAVVNIVEGILGQPASVYIDAKNESKVTVTAYLKKASDWSMAKRARLQRNLAPIKEVGLKLGAGSIRATRIQRENWAESWKRHFKPLEIGSALLLKPSWSQRKAKRNQAEVILDPGLSFGTGQHPTTRFCLEQIVSVRKPETVQSFLDIGTGSGILAITAAKLGYHPVTALDVDPEAIRVARFNAKRNTVSRKVHLLCQDLTRLPKGRLKKADLVCANLVFDLLLAERERVFGLLTPGSRLILAGILRRQFAEVRAAYEEAGLKLIAFKSDHEWASGAFAAA